MRVVATLKSADIQFRFAIIETEDGDRFIVGLDRISKLVPSLEYGKKFVINLGGY